MADFEEYLTVELKSEMANSYFGFRKLIEEDSLEYRDKVRQYSFILEKRISFDLIRIYILLQAEELIDAFLDLCNLEKKLFYDPYLIESETIRERVFESVRMRGLTRQGRFQNFLVDCYDRLDFHINSYRKKYKELEDIHDDIAEEIKLFEKRHDLSAMMSFLHSLGAQPVAGNMEQGLETGVSLAIAKKLKIDVPEDVEYHLPVLPELPAYGDIKKELFALSEQAYGLQKESFLVLFANNFFRPRA
ncbi:MAG: hypothetical protein ABFS09_06470 [Thermodesulfobacteriota bacterium]